MDLIVTNKREVRKEKLTGRDAVGLFALRVNGLQEEIKSYCFGFWVLERIGLNW